MLSTGDELIVEKTPVDRYWGCRPRRKRKKPVGGNFDGSPGNLARGKGKRKRILNKQARERKICIMERSRKRGGTTVAQWGYFLNFIYYLGVSIPLVLLGYLLFLWSTPYREIELIRAGADTEDDTKVRAQVGTAA